MGPPKQKPQGFACLEIDLQVDHRGQTSKTHRTALKRQYPQTCLVLGTTIRKWTKELPLALPLLDLLFGDWVNPIDDPGANIFTRSDPSTQEQAEPPQLPPEAVLTKEELEAAVGVEAAASALESLVVTGEPSGAATAEPSAPVVEGVEENEFGVDYRAEEEDVEVEGEAPSAPPTDAEAAAPEQPDRPKRRGTKAGAHVKQKEATKTFHNVGYPAARDWLRDFTARHCGGTPFKLDKPSFRPNPDYSPLVRLITAFDAREARFDPLLVLARLQNYVPALQKYIGNRNRDLLSDIYQRARESRQQFRGQPRGADPLDRFEDPVRETRVNLKPDIDGLGPQFEKQKASEERTRRQQGPPVKASATPFGWHPTLNRGEGSGSQKPPEPDLPPKSTATASTDPVPLQPQPPQHPPEERQSGRPRSPPVPPRGRVAEKVPVDLKPAVAKASKRARLQVALKPRRLPLRKGLHLRPPQRRQKKLLQLEKSSCKRSLYQHHLRLHLRALLQKGLPLALRHQLLLRSPSKCSQKVKGHQQRSGSHHPVAVIGKEPVLSLSGSLVKRDFGHLHLQGHWCCVRAPAIKSLGPTSLERGL